MSLATTELRSEPFWDARLTPQENKAAEMRFNGFNHRQIAEELDVDVPHVRVLFSRARSKGVWIEKAHGGRPSPWSNEYLGKERDRLKRLGRRDWCEVLSERTGLSQTTIHVRLWRHRQGRR